MQLLLGLYGTADSINFSEPIEIFFPATKFVCFLPLHEIYFDTEKLSHILSSINSYKFTNQYHLNGRVKSYFPENRAEIPDIL